MREREIHILSYSRQRLDKNLGIIDTSFGVPYPCRTLDMPRTLLHAYPNYSLYIYIYIQNMARTQEQEESNTPSQNKESIHALNSNSVFEN